MLLVELANGAPGAKSSGPGSNRTPAVKWHCGHWTVTLAAMYRSWPPTELPATGRML
jgi:hypothetical protein